MRNTKQSGFTLMELLVVMVIIGILALITVAYLNSSKYKATDATIMNITSTAREQSNLYFYNTGDYTGICLASLTDDPAGVSDFVAELQVLSTSVSCGENTTPHGWGLEARLTDGRYFCVDGTNLATTSINSSNVSDAEPQCDGV